MLADLFFLSSGLLVLTLAVSAGIAALRRRWTTARKLLVSLAVYAAGYVFLLVSVALSLPRQFREAGERQCFDDWCVAGIEATVADNATEPGCSPDGGSVVWMVTAEVSSRAKRRRQRAADAWAELEDAAGNHFAACSSAPAGPEPEYRSMRDALDPGESFRVRLRFRLPGGAQPSGLVIHHGDFPGILIIGSEGFLRQRTLLRLHVTASPPLSSIRPLRH